MPQIVVSTEQKGHCAVCGKVGDAIRVKSRTQQVSGEPSWEFRCVNCLAGVAFVPDKREGTASDTRWPEIEDNPEVSDKPDEAYLQGYFDGQKETENRLREIAPDPAPVTRTIYAGYRAEGVKGSVFSEVVIFRDQAYCGVHVEPLPLYEEVFNLSRDFAWGGPGPATLQLAGALIYDALGCNRDQIELVQVLALELFDELKRWWKDEWHWSADEIRAWAKAKAEQVSPDGH